MQDTPGCKKGAYCTAPSKNQAIMNPLHWHHKYGERLVTRTTKNCCSGMLYPFGKKTSLCNMGLWLKFTVDTYRHDKQPMQPLMSQWGCIKWENYWSFKQTRCFISWPSWTILLLNCSKSCYLQVNSEMRSLVEYWRKMDYNEDFAWVRIIVNAFVM